MTTIVEVTSSIPAPIARLTELAGNLFFSWHRPTRALFQDLDPELWRQVSGNPRLMLRCIDQPHLNRVASDAEYLARYQQVMAAYDAYHKAPPTGVAAPLVAYFCAEYGFHESFPIYSGGLGILAGDHCKAASDERLNFVAVGLLYRQGYFIQAVDSEGEQHAQYNDRDPRDLPVEPVRTAAGEWLTVRVRIGAQDVAARVWRAQVGRVAVYLLDTNCPENSSADRDITYRLYGGDDAVRIRQEMILGIGGAHALRALNLAPAVWHINEGHAAFLILELLREGLGRGLDYAAALEAAAVQCVFTTHTPVAAGHDVFSDDLFIACFGEFIRELGVAPERIIELGRGPNARHGFNMTRLALAGARRINGVSRIHGTVSAQLCADHWPEVPPAENPVGYVTNGVHVPTFLANTWSRFFDKVLGADWTTHMWDPAFWQRLEKIPDALFWETAQHAKSRMIAGVHERLRLEYARKGLSPAQLRHVTRLLDPDRPDVLTLGFARRFATYKRAALLLRDRARLAKLIDGSERPVLFLFAGKAHPADVPGQQVLREIKQLMLSPEFSGHVVFLEDYDIQLARWLVSGVDVWLNNPIAPLEASGTSGIKAAINGRLNVSVLDGWWAEAFDGTNGWGIPPAQTQEGERRDAFDAEAMLDALEEEVVPLYYARNAEGYSPEWVRRCKRAMMTVIPQFSMGRVVTDYARGIYLPAAAQHAAVADHDDAGARALSQWKHRVRQAWGGVGLRRLSAVPRELRRDARLRMRVAVALNGMTPDDVKVEFSAVRLLPEEHLQLPALASFRGTGEAGHWSDVLSPTGETDSDGSHVFELDASPPASGQFSLQLRVRPDHPLLAHPLELGLVKRL
ncbi:MAG TPA: alpha-glucan family phosphorylase [Steroidobacteraceae bacterium]|nr:alpha-glucan family phosphorylase [Steroidobacteraceae bacterium]